MKQRGRPPGSRNKPKRKDQEQATMFSLPSLGGAAQLIELVMAYGGPERVCKDLQISRELLDRYCQDNPPAPYTTALAIWWQGPYGFNQAFSEAHRTHLHNYGMRLHAEERIRQLETTLTEIIIAIGPGHPAIKLVSAN